MQVVLDLQNRRPVYRTRTCCISCPKGGVRTILGFEDGREKRIYIGDKIPRKLNN
jgi:hypothetical protein